MAIIRLNSTQYKRIIACSDIHNDYAALKRGVDDELKLGQGDLLIVVGDLLDRSLSPNPDRCLRLCLDNWRVPEAREYDVIYLKGNHEAMIAEFIAENYYENYRSFPITRYEYNTIELLETVCGGRYSQKDIQELGKRLYAQDLMVEIQDGDTLYRIAHAAVPADEHIDEIDEEYVLWGNMEFYKNKNVEFRGNGEQKRLVRICGHSDVHFLRWMLRQLTETEKDDEIWISKSDDGSDTIIDIDCGNGYRIEDDKKHRLAFLNIKTMDVLYV